MTFAAITVWTGKTGIQTGEHSCRHGGIQKGAENAAMNRSKQIQVFGGRLQLKNHMALFQMDQAVSDQSGRRRLGCGAVQKAREIRLADLFLPLVPAGTGGRIALGFFLHISPFRSAEGVPLPLQASEGFRAEAPG